MALVADVLRSPGQPLPSSSRAFLEPRFGYDFSRVRVHNDELSARSASALGAAAYAVGNRVALPAQITAAMSPRQQRMLLAHELAHVVQQGAASPDVSQLKVLPPSSTLELQAERAAADVVDGSASRALLSPSRPTIARSLFGSVVGGLTGAALGGAAGLALGGPVTAVAGGLIGGVAGAFAGDILSETGRAINAAEKKEAQCVFGDSIDWSRVRITEAPVMGSFGNARTPLETIYFPPGKIGNNLAYYGWLVHELTHVWQTQHGISLASKVWTALHGGVSKSAYDYGHDAGLIAAAQAGRGFRSFNTEQQGDILEFFYYRLKENGDVTPFLPFVREVRGNTPPPSC